MNDSINNKMPGGKMHVPKIGGPSMQLYPDSAK